MDQKTIRQAKVLNLKPNKYFKDVSWPFLYQKRQTLMNIVTHHQINGDDVGLGKTSEMIIAFSYLKSANPNLKALVFTERNALRQWKKEFAKLCPDIKVKVVTAVSQPDPVERSRLLRQHGVDVIISTYSLAYKYSHHMLAGMGPEWVFIADEPNYFKSTDSLLHQNVYGMTVGDMNGDPFRIVRVPGEKKGQYEEKILSIPGCKRAQRAYGLTATIIENRLEEAFGIMRIVTPGIFSSYAEFEKNYCVTKKIKNRKVVTGYKNLDAFRKQIAPAFYGRLQDDPEVQQDLPEVIPKDMEIELSKAQSLKLVEAMDRLIQMPGGEVKQLQMLPALTMCQQLANDPRLLGFNIEGEKTSTLLETVENSLAGQRVAIYSKYRTQVDLLEEVFKKKGHEIVRITGKESQAERELAQDRFMSDGADRCNILMFTKAGQKAMNLQKGGHLFFYDLPWSYGIYRQIIGRFKRTGSIHKVIGVYRMLACLHPDVAAAAGMEDTTIDHHTLNVVMRKFALWQAVTGDVKEVITNPADIAAIWEEVRNSHRKAA